MTASTKRLLETWIRLLKGCLRATQVWLSEQPVEADPSPTNHTTELGG